MQEWLVLGVDAWETEKTSICARQSCTRCFESPAFVCLQYYRGMLSVGLEGLGQDSAYNGHLLALIIGSTPFSPGLESVVSPGDRDLDGSLTSSGQTK